MFCQNISGQKYCSPVCGDEGRKAAARVELTCSYCEGVYWRHRGKSITSKYCSLSCKNSAGAERRAAREMSPEEYQYRLAEQGGVCALCKRPDDRLNLARDHCHKTGAWRGLLCGRCNKALGLFRDDPELLRAAAEYVEREVFSLRRQFEAHSENKSLSNDGVRQLILAYRADKSGAVIPGWQPKKGFLYTQVRAISARINQNYDAWPSTELKKSYRTFLGKPVFVNHNNFDPSRARGRVIAARYVEAGNDKYVEVIQEIDAQRFPKLASEIRSGGLDSVSMGVEAGFTICSYCNNKATDAHDMCDHVKYHKGEKLRKHNHRTGKIEDVMVYENCYKLGFFELSYVFDPADETAVVSKVLVANRKKADNYIDPSDVGPVANDPKPALSVPMYVPGQTYGEDNEAVQMPPIVTPFGKGSSLPVRLLMPTTVASEIMEPLVVVGVNTPLVAEVSTLKQADC